MSVLAFRDRIFREGVPRDYRGWNPCLPIEAMFRIAERAALQLRVQRDDAQERGACPVCEGHGVRWKIMQPWGPLGCHICKGTGRFTR
jgi:hypothetical protein